MNNFFAWNHCTCGIQTQIIEEVLEKLRFYQVEMATGDQIKTELNARGIMNPKLINRFILGWGVVEKTGDAPGIADHLVRSVLDTRAELRDEIVALTTQVSKKMAQLKALAEKQ